MIQANELRIGNWVMGAVGRLYQVDINLLTCINANPDWADPVPLTPELLLEKCGFTKYPYDADEEDIQYYILKAEGWEGQISYYKDGSFYVSGNHSPNFYGAKVDLKYLHQLQNLFFSHANKEMEINL